MNSLVVRGSWMARGQEIFKRADSATFSLRGSRRACLRSKNVHCVSLLVMYSSFSSASGHPVDGMTVRGQIADLVRQALASMFPEGGEIEPLVYACAKKFGDYQCNNAMNVWSKIAKKTSEFKSPHAIGQGIMRSLPASPLIEKTSVAGPGFVNIILSNAWIEERIHKMLIYGIGTWALDLGFQRVVVDFSSPNTAKRLHVGHLRSTVLGDCIAKLLEYCNVEVLRRNHVGDWGTQFGMLIEYFFQEYLDWEESGREYSIDELQAMYKASRIKFKEDPAFKEKAQQAVVLLQGGHENYRKVWKQFCDVSRQEYNQIYNRLNVKLQEKGESFYNPIIPSIIEELESKDLLEEYEGARVIHLEEQSSPLVVVKKDGGFNYASTDLAALWYRLNVEKADWIIYVTDVGQSLHFDKLFSAARQASWLPADSEQLPRTTHVGFGLVLGPDGKKFKARDGEAVPLADLLDEAQTRSKKELIERGNCEADELEQAVDALGYGAVKYADLKNNRTTDYTFDYNQMLDCKGNSAVYLLYTHARICSIIEKSRKNMDELKQMGAVMLTQENERLLGLHLIRFPEIVDDTIRDLLPSTLCEYLYSVSDIFNKFYSTCQVVGSEEENSRLLLCEATRTVMRKCFHLLGITPLHRL